MCILHRTPEIDSLVAITKSDSGVSGPELAKAHIRLGELLGATMKLDPEDTTVVALLRGGIFFGQGIYFALGCKYQLYDPKKGSFERPSTKNVILADSVINSGKTIMEIWEPDMLVACCVANKEATKLFGAQMHTVRISNNSFVGAHVHAQKGNVGPDTTLRLFNQI